MQRLPYSVGIDIISIDRIERALSRHPSFASRILTESEAIEMPLLRKGGNQEPSFSRRSVEFLAARFAVKEAASKSLHINLFSVSFHDFEVKKHPVGYPTLSVSDVIRNRFIESGELSFEVSISHERRYAVAVVNSYIIKEDQGS
ncbi:MAG: holo-ACP synthase [Actinomycetota bacterium]|nr:holo-ACP synthase [Actinomycetota bacterium]